MPRVSLRRGLLYLCAATTCSLLLVTVHQPGTAWLSQDPLPSMPRVPPPPPSNLDHPVLIQDTRPSPHHTHGRELEESHDVPHALPPIPRPRPLLNVTLVTQPPEQRPWYLQGGEMRPEVPAEGDQWTRTVGIWPSEDSSDRIVEQLMFRPPLPPPLEDHPDTAAGASERAPLTSKKILMMNGMGSWGLRPGRGIFMKLKCPVDTCVLTSSRNEMTTADAILFKDHFTMPPHTRDPRQVWAMFMLECPLHTQYFKNKDVFNWTATYRSDSDIVAPYEKWVYYDSAIRQKPQEVNYAANKTKQVAWFVSNCGARNNRLQYAKELGKYIGVDIYGACGTKRCPRSNSAKCFDMLNRDYKFYLAFENSNCRDYITEKFFVNGLRGLPKQASHHILPIVMGAHPDDYSRQAPEKSYIHVDDFESPKDLADYLHLLDQNDDLYNEYFRWKGTGEFINTYFMCRVCSMLHDEGHQQHYEDINHWWRGSGTCISGSWRKYDRMKSDAAAAAAVAAAEQKKNTKNSDNNNNNSNNNKV